MQTLSLAAQFEMLRAQLESALPTPSIVVVSSARAGDGKELVARGLADSLQAADYETLLVHADAAASPNTTAIGPDRLSDVIDGGVRRYAYKTTDAGSDCIELSSNECRRGASHESIAKLCASFRSNYRFTVIDAATIYDNNLALFFAMAVAGVLLTVREGRRVSSLDRELALALQRSEIRLLGVVSVAANAIREQSRAFAKRTAEYPRIICAGATIEKPHIERQPV